MEFKGIQFPDEAEVKMPTDLCLIVRGLDENGESVYSVLWASQSENNLPEFVVGLGMTEAAKIDYMERTCFAEDDDD